MSPASLKCNCIDARPVASRKIASAVTSMRKRSPRLASSPRLGSALECLVHGGEAALVLFERLSKERDEHTSELLCLHEPHASVREGLDLQAVLAIEDPG
jgi:hypothetical protein